jgi:hypothetical protein
MHVAPMLEQGRAHLFGAHIPGVFIVPHVQDAWRAARTTQPSTRTSTGFVLGRHVLLRQRLLLDGCYRSRVQITDHRHCPETVSAV